MALGLIATLLVVAMCGEAAAEKSSCFDSVVASITKSKICFLFKPVQHRATCKIPADYSGSAELVINQDTNMFTLSAPANDLFQTGKICFNSFVQADPLTDKYTLKIAGEEIPSTRIKISQLMKTIKKMGDGKTHPTTGQKVTVHYTGYLMSGKKFDSSVDRGEPFTFTIGQGQVIAGWDQGVADMTVGEKATLLIPFKMAYGERGHTPVIPPKADLIFEVELLKVED